MTTQIFVHNGRDGAWVEFRTRSGKSFCFQPVQQWQLGRDGMFAVVAHEWARDQAGLTEPEPEPVAWGRSVLSVGVDPPWQLREDQRMLGMMNAIQPTHEEKVRAVFRDLRQSSKDLVRFERIVYGVPGEDDPPHGEGDRNRLAAEHDGIQRLLRRLGELEPKSMPAAGLGERVETLLKHLKQRRENVQAYRHGLVDKMYVVDRERRVDWALAAITNTIAYDWGEHRPDPIKRSWLEALADLMVWKTEKKPWYMRFTNRPGPL